MKEVSLWTVRWTKTSRPFYGVPKDDHGLIPLLEDIVRFNVNKHHLGRPKMRWAMIYPLFDTKEEADAYRADIQDWETIQVSITPSN